MSRDQQALELACVALGQAFYVVLWTIFLGAAIVFAVAVDGSPWLWRALAIAPLAYCAVDIAARTGRATLVDSDDDRGERSQRRGALVRRVIGLHGGVMIAAIGLVILGSSGVNQIAAENWTGLTAIDFAFGAAAVCGLIALMFGFVVRAHALLPPPALQPSIGAEA